ncbi:MAG: helix-turn-helix transcriptional regulator [Anaerolineae bacterium]|nr:helix-turn-helix transcriptional regulator [Anaerolineae bacterium]
MEPIDRRQLGARIRRAREHKGISQYELGRHFSWDPLTVSRIEAGARELKISEIARLAEYLKVPVGYFLPEWFEEPAKESPATTTSSPQQAQPQSPTASIGRLVSLIVVAVVVVVAAVFVLRMVQAGSAPPPGQGESYEEWLRAIARPVMIHRVSPAIVRVMDCMEAKDTECLCNPSIVPDRAEFLAEVKEHKAQVPANLGSLHTSLEDAVEKYQRLRVNVRGFCDRGASVAGLDSLDNEVQRAAKARDKAIINLLPYE